MTNPQLLILKVLQPRIRQVAVIVLLKWVLVATQCFAQDTVSEKDLKGIVRTSLDSPKPTKTQLARRLRSNNAIRALGLPALETLPVTEDESTIKPHRTDEIVKRCIAVEICAIKGESNDQVLTKAIVKRFSAAKSRVG